MGQSVIDHFRFGDRYRIYRACLVRSCLLISFCTGGFPKISIAAEVWGEVLTLISDINSCLDGRNRSPRWMQYLVAGPRLLSFKALCPP